MSLTRCTLTGVDASTSLDAIADISDRFPFVEWGFLYSPKRQGQPGRYPSVDTLRRAFEALPQQVQVALHVCGQGVPDLLAGECVITELVEKVARRNGRVQLNFNAATEGLTLSSLMGLFENFPATTFITQHNLSNAPLLARLREYGIANHATLFDSSGGRGLSPMDWSPPLIGIQCGYAGGLGPINLSEKLPEIHAAAHDTDYWIDMEGKLRDADDRFNLDAAKASLEAVAEFHPRCVEKDQNKRANMSV